MTVDGEYVVTSSIEAARMREERTPDIEVVDYPWYEDPGALLHRLAGPGVYIHKDVCVAAPGKVVVQEAHALYAKGISFRLHAVRGFSAAVGRAAGEDARP